MVFGAFWAIDRKYGLLQSIDQKFCFDDVSSFKKMKSEPLSSEAFMACCFVTREN
jgi:hypothetical protein